jgi:hypothetical protein
MRTAWLTLIAMTLGLSGCTTTDNQITKPPPVKPEWIVPPEGDPRWSNPPVYPDKVLTSGQPRKPESSSTQGQMGQGAGGMRPPSMTGGPSGSGRY